MPTYGRCPVNSQNPINTVASRTLTFVYGTEHQRIMQRTQVDSSAPSSMRSGRVYYLNGSNNDLGYEKEVTDAGMTEHKHYLSAGGMVFAMQITRSGTLGNKPAENLQYLHHDHLGSVAVVTDSDGSVTERLAYDPWGKRRFPNGMADKDDTIVGLAIDRGFTMHEHLDEMGLIHMNGRIFDPLIGRFMSADPFIQAPENLQSHNRFAYVMNNPLAFTDPSGYFSWRKFLGKTIIRIVAAVADAFGCSGYCSMAVNAYYGYKSGGVAGFIASFIPGSDNAWANAAIDAGKGCVVSSANGGSCGRGAAGGVVGGMGGNSDVGQMLAGCIASRINGGSCGDGAADRFSSMAARYVADVAVDIYTDARRTAAQESQRRADRLNSVACAPACLPIIIYAPEAIGAATFLWNATRAYFAVRGISRLLTANEAAAPEGSNGTDAAAGGVKQPPNSKPISETPWSGDHQGIKGQSGAGPSDNVRITPDGQVWVQRPGGTWENTGNASDMIGGSEAAGQRGRDREPEWKKQRGRKQRGDDHY